MIEFTAECGHTVRAKDDAAGGVVRCSYCGVQVDVPMGETRSLDYLFRDVDQPDEELKKRRRKRRKPRRKSETSGGAPGGIDVTAVILRMCYAAFLLSVVIFVVDSYVLPQFRDSEESPATLDADADPAPETDHKLPAQKRSRDVASTPSLGLKTRRNAVGLYVNSTPPSAFAYCIEESRAPDEGTISETKGSTKTSANGTSLSVSDGTYVVEVMLPWNDPNLNDSTMPYFSQYREFRRAIEYATDYERRELLEEYFVPDGSVEVFVHQTPDQIFMVRRFVDIRVRDGRSRGVRALFLPKVADEEGGAFSIQPLLDRYLPKERVYGFNRGYVQGELDYYEVPLTDREAVLQALSTVGLAPYVTRDGRTRLFGIGINDGAFSARIIRDTG